MPKIIQIIRAPAWDDELEGFFRPETFYGLGDDGILYTAHLDKDLPENEDMELAWRVAIKNKFREPKLL